MFYCLGNLRGKIIHEDEKLSVLKINGDKLNTIEDFKQRLKLGTIDVRGTNTAPMYFQYLILFKNYQYSDVNINDIKKINIDPYQYRELYSLKREFIDICDVHSVGISVAKDTFMHAYYDESLSDNDGTIYRPLLPPIADENQRRFSFKKIGETEFELVHQNLYSVDNVQNYDFSIFNKFENILINGKNLEEALSAINKRKNLSRICNHYAIAAQKIDLYCSGNEITRKFSGKLTSDGIISYFGSEKKSGNKIEIFNAALSRFANYQDIVSQKGKKFIIKAKPGHAIGTFGLDRIKSVPLDVILSMSPYLKIIASISDLGDVATFTVEVQDKRTESFINCLFGLMEADKCVEMGTFEVGEIESEIEKYRNFLIEKNKAKESIQC